MKTQISVCACVLAMVACVSCGYDQPILGAVEESPIDNNQPADSDVGGGQSANDAGVPTNDAGTVVDSGVSDDAGAVADAGTTDAGAAVCAVNSDCFDSNDAVQCRSYLCLGGKCSYTPVRHGQPCGANGHCWFGDCLVDACADHRDCRRNNDDDQCLNIACGANFQCFADPIREGMECGLGKGNCVKGVCVKDTPDAGTDDAGTDVGVDAGSDAGVDAGTDAGQPDQHSIVMNGGACDAWSDLGGSLASFTSNKVEEVKVGDEIAAMTCTTVPLACDGDPNTVCLVLLGHEGDKSPQPGCDFRSRRCAKYANEADGGTLDAGADAGMDAGADVGVADGGVDAGVDAGAQLDAGVADVGIADGGIADGGADAGDAGVCADDSQCGPTDTVCRLNRCEGGQCLPVNVNEGLLCESDGQLCTSDICRAGVCEHQPISGCLPCDVDAQCGSDACRPGTCFTGTCFYNTVVCEAGKTCDHILGCIVPECVADAGCTATPSDDCHEFKCVTNKCSEQPKTVGTTCDDGDLRSFNDACNANGVCQGEPGCLFNMDCTTHATDFCGDDHKCYSPTVLGGCVRFTIRTTTPAPSKVVFYGPADERALKTDGIYNSHPQQCAAVGEPDVGGECFLGNGRVVSIADLPCGGRGCAHDGKRKCATDADCPVGFSSCAEEKDACGAGVNVKVCKPL